MRSVDMKPFKYLIIGLALLRSTATTGQDIGNLASHFDSVAYYPDSTVKGLYHLRKERLDGQAVEFNESGEPTDIGEFKRGERKGTWISSNGHWVKYRHGKREWGGVPGCGTGRIKARVTFQERYAEIIARP